MKKLMIVLVAVAITACAQAATVSWSAAMGTMSSSQSDATKYTAVLIDASVYSLTTAAADLVSGQFKYDNSAVLATTPGIAQGANFRFSQSNVEQSSASTPYAAGNVVTAYAIIFNGTPTEGTEAMILSSKQATVASTGLASFSFGALNQAGAVAATWSTVNVPEPTSGLLLLLGMTGLALRRRRA